MSVLSGSSWCVECEIPREGLIGVGGGYAREGKGEEECSLFISRTVTGAQREPCGSGGWLLVTRQSEGWLSRCHVTSRGIHN